MCSERTAPVWAKRIPGRSSLHKLSDILAADCCTGCGICASLLSDRVSMHLSEEGFLRPVENATLSADDEAVVDAVCPGIRLEQETGHRHEHVLWGPYVAVQSGYAIDPELRFKGSSGGVLSAVLCYLLDTETVDYVLQIAEDGQSPIGNALIESRSRDDIIRAAGSRYSPSSPLADIVSRLERAERFALVAKPCDIAAVRALGRRDARVGEKIPVLFSFFCAGIPSLDGTREILRELNVEEDQVASFRYRGEGWPGFAKATMKDGRTASMSYMESWGDILSRHVQFRCKICPDGTGAFADIVCGDAWECDEDGYPLFQEQDGISLVVARTDKGRELLDGAESAGYVQLSDQDIEAVEAMQPGQANRKRLVLSRLAALIALRNCRPRFSGLRLVRAAAAGGLWPNIRSFLGMVRRLVFRPRYKGF